MELDGRWQSLDAQLVGPFASRLDRALDDNLMAALPSVVLLLVHCGVLDPD